MTSPQHKVATAWSYTLAYAIGIIASDGNLSKSGRHISITSKDREIVDTIKRDLGLSNSIGVKSRGGSREKQYFVLQFGDVMFYRFLESIGVQRQKSRTISTILIPDKYFFHFLRGVIDGDGNIQASDSLMSKHKQLKLRIASASDDFIIFLNSKIKALCNPEGGWVYVDKKKRVNTLTYGKRDAIIILRKVYKNKQQSYLTRKYKIAKMFI
jgi:hypothetical protein